MDVWRRIQRIGCIDLAHVREEGELHRYPEYAAVRIAIDHVGHSEVQSERLLENRIVQLTSNYGCCELTAQCELRTACGLRAHS